MRRKLGIIISIIRGDSESGRRRHTLKVSYDSQRIEKKKLIKKFPVVITFMHGNFTQAEFIGQRNIKRKKIGKEPRKCPYANELFNHRILLLSFNSIQIFFFFFCDIEQ